MHLQDLHIHTIFSRTDSAVVPEQTLDLIEKIRHAKTIGISDHFECMYRDATIEEYIGQVRKKQFLLGTEINGADWVDQALEHDFDYHVYHCWNENKHYKAIEKLLATGKPLIIAHPYATDTRIDKLPREVFLEINNRYIFRFDWKKYLGPHVNDFEFVLSSDAHQPNWLNQNVAMMVAKDLQVQESLVFRKEKIS